MTKEEQRIYNKKYHSIPENKEKARAKRISYCEINKERMSLYWKNRYKENKELVASVSLKKLYGITQDDYNRMYNEQDGKCYICYRHQSKLKRALSVDHCHRTNKVRKLLCDKCNTALGLCQENSTILTNLIKYLSDEQE